MPRQKSPDSKDVTMSARFSEAEAALVDAARGTADRGAWLREVALAAARRPARKPPVVLSRGDRAALQHEAERAPERGPRRDPKNCKHEGLRLTKGYCPDCETMAVKK